MTQYICPHFENDSDAEQFVEDSIIEYKKYLNKKNIYLEDNIEYDKYFVAIYLLFIYYIYYNTSILSSSNVGAPSSN